MATMSKRWEHVLLTSGGMIVGGLLLVFAGFFVGDRTSSTGFFMLAVGTVLSLVGLVRVRSQPEEQDNSGRRVLPPEDSPRYTLSPDDQ